MPKNQGKITTIKLQKETKTRLDGLKEYSRETYDELINKILDIINISIKNPIAGARIFRSIKRKRLSKEGLQKTFISSQENRDELELS